MLGVLTIEGPGEADRLLDQVAAGLMARGIPLAGAVQRNPEGARDGRCHMDLHVLAADRTVRISQDLGALAKGCRLDPGGLETAVGLAEAALEGDPTPRLVIVNKFGKQEVDGKGFRPLIGRALAAGVPVLVGVSAGNRDGFDAFAEGLSEQVHPTYESLMAWAEKAAA
ncbi:MAG: DUF2478 domain-containing protein [Pseudomonadota bacterium]